VHPDHPQPGRGPQPLIPPNPRPQRPGNQPTDWLERIATRALSSGIQKSKFLTTDADLEEALMTEATCLQYGWDVVAAAAANSQLAGVLAGFVFTGIVFLFGRSGLRNIQAITLLSSAFVVLAFDSYLYSLVAGGAEDKICIRVWSESMPAGGLLGIGGAAVVTGLCRLAYDYADQDLARSTKPFRQAVLHLHRLARTLVYGVTFAVSLLLVSAISEYLNVAFSNKPPAF
jgi:hypothetical protein